jgi:hypothetical protein
MDYSIDSYACHGFAVSMDHNKTRVHEYVAACNRGHIDGVCGSFTDDAFVYGALGRGELAKGIPL